MHVPTDGEEVAFNVIQALVDEKCKVRRRPSSMRSAWIVGVERVGEQEGVGKLALIELEDAVDRLRQAVRQPGKTALDLMMLKEAERRADRAPRREAEAA